MTHRAVDSAAGVPAGSTSNYFRTRDALIEAVVDRFTAREQAAWERIAAAVRPGTAGELANGLATFAIEATGPQRTLTLSRYASSSKLPSARCCNSGWRAVRASCGPGAPGGCGPSARRTHRDAQLVLDQVDGLVLHQLAFPDPEFNPAGPLTVLIEALVSRR